MKKSILFLFFFIFFSCSETDLPESTVIDSKNTIIEIRNIAKQYGYEFKTSNTNKGVLKVTNSIELEQMLVQIKNNFDQTRVYTSGDLIGKPSLEEVSKMIDMNYEDLSKEGEKKTLNSKGTQDDPPYKYARTIYLDQDYPCSNVRITIQYNTNSAGSITNYKITSDTWGQAFGNTYSQISVNSYSSKGSLAFKITGEFKTTLGLPFLGSNFTMSNSDIMEFSGYMQNPTALGGGTIYVKAQRFP